MQQRRLVVTPSNNIESFKQSLSGKYRSQTVEINPIEKEKISTVVKKVQFPYSVQNCHFYINEETVNLLASSSHPLLKEWGDKCKSFYTSDPLNKFVEPASGLVVAQRGGMYTDWCFAGNGAWSWLTNSWVPVPGSYTCKGYDGIQEGLNTRLYTNHAEYPPIHPPNLSTSPFKLLSPLHIAVLLDDENLIQYLISIGARVDDDLNEWHLTPIELSVMYEKSKAVVCLLQKNATNIDKILKLAIEKASFFFIEKIISCVSLTQEAAEAARSRDHELYYYLDARRKNDALKTIQNEGVVKALQSFLSQKVIPLQSIVDLICDHPETVMNPLPNDLNGNTIFHWAITTGELKKIQALMEGFYEAKLRTPGLNVDIEKANKQNKTVLDMALAQTNHEITSLVLLYLDPKMSDIQKTQILTAKIDPHAIDQKRNAMTQNIICNLHQRIDTTQEVAAKTLLTQMEMREEQIAMQEGQALLKNKIMQLEQMLMLVCQHLTPNLPNEVPGQPLMLPHANNLNLFFAAQQDQNEPVRIAAAQQVNPPAVQ